MTPQESDVVDLDLDELVGSEGDLSGVTGFDELDDDALQMLERLWLSRKVDTGDFCA